MTASPGGAAAPLFHGEAMTLYVSDLDGTLLDRQGQLSEATRTGLAELLAQGLVFTVASARHVVSIRQLLAGLRLSLPVISSNGAFISDLATGRHELVHGMDGALGEAIFALVRRHGQMPFLSVHTPEGDRLCWQGVENEGQRHFVDERVLNGDPRLRQCTDLARELGGGPLMTLVVVWLLLKVPGLMLVGGLGLLWIAYKLLADTGENEHAGPASHTFWGAMKTIIVADALMGIDNVLGVAGAAHGAMDLVVIGLLISVPIVVFGSTMVLKLVERFPVIIQLGAAVLAATAASMIAGEPLLAGWFGPREAPAQALRWALAALCIVGVLGAAWLMRTRLQNDP